MQTIKRETLIKKASELLENGTVDRVLGWKRGEFDYDVSPNVFRSVKELENEFVWNTMCGANFSKYLVKETRKSDKKVLVFLKACDSYSFNQLLTEHRFDRERVYAVGIPCDGMTDISAIKSIADGIRKTEETEDGITVHTLYDGDIVLKTEDILSERCRSCKSNSKVEFDEIIGRNGEKDGSERFAEVKRLEKMTPDERFAFWQSELSRCIRCNACRDVCPACTCEKCVFDNPDSGVENKAAADPFEEKLFHVIRAYHVAGRCTDCGECSRVCPQHIPLHLLNRKLIKDIDTLYGEYRAGEETGKASPLTSYSVNDPDACDALKGDFANG